MRIGIDCRLWGESGVGRYTRNLVQQLQELDKKNEYVLFVKDNFSEDGRWNMEGGKWKIVRSNIRWHSIEEQIKFPSILNRENLDLVHFPYFSVPIFYNKPFVVTIHDLIINHFPTGQATTLSFPLYRLKLLGYKFVILQAAEKAKKIITVSEATKMEIVNHLGVLQTKLVVTYEGVDQKNSNLKTQNPKPSQTWSTSKLKPQNYFLYVGNAYPHKNLERFLEAFQEFRIQNSEFKNTNKNLKLALVGKSDYFYQRLKTRVKEVGLEEQVIFYGEANDSELAWLYKNALALVVPSLMEGFGLPALEAMSQGCLVLASDIPALHEVCGKVAIYFNPYDIKEIAVKMKQVVNHFNDSYHYSDLIKKGLERAKMFSWEKMAKETLKVYNSLK